MSLLHFSHEHTLILKKEVSSIDGGDEMLCYGCHQPILPPSSAAAASNGNGDVYICGDATCNYPFYLHKKCAESPKEIHHPMHDLHPLILQSRPLYPAKLCRCNVCGRPWEWFTYNCISCHFDVCITCATVGDRSFRHVGHGQHTLTLMKREALFVCDACGTEAKDSSYACNSCEFWMHKSCALSPTTVEADFIHKHPLVLTYSLPDMHRNFYQKCRLCNEMVYTSDWLYYCDKCTYFGHIKCIAKSISSGEKDKSEAEPQEKDKEEDDLVQFPVHSKQSFIDLITKQFANRYITLERHIGAALCSTSTGDHPQEIINHWSHEEHPLELLEEIVGSEQVEEIICNGCIQPITQAAANPFYGCIQCNFFLHKFCLQLPLNLPAGEHSCHPQHPLVLSRKKNKFFYARCAACALITNGFYYLCETCDHFQVDVGCYFLPNKIKHQSHSYPLHPWAFDPGDCHACGLSCKYGQKFVSGRMGHKFHIHQRCALLPGTMRHRWDPHPILLIYPPFDHQGLIYCEICEDEINPNYWLYHCRECDHSFHTSCLRPFHNMKLGDQKVVAVLHKHTLTFVAKRKQDHHFPFLCSSCSKDLGNISLVLECVNCDMLFCVGCVSSNF